MARRRPAWSSQPKTNRAWKTSTVRSAIGKSVAEPTRPSNPCDRWASTASGLMSTGRYRSAGRHAVSAAPNDVLSPAPTSATTRPARSSTGAEHSEAQAVHGGGHAAQPIAFGGTGGVGVERR